MRRRQIYASSAVAQSPTPMIGSNPIAILVDDNKESAPPQFAKPKRKTLKLNYDKA